MVLLMVPSTLRIQILSLNMSVVLRVLSALRGKSGVSLKGALFKPLTLVSNRTPLHDAIVPLASALGQGLVGSPCSTWALAPRGRQAPN